ncbi:MAG: DUF707 domain-containing protein [Clostridium sp.]|nr:DUF707 domain-containing protein [Clostridium sp.]
MKNNNTIIQKNCLISAVGKNSLHKLWTDGGHNFDMHLIVYDDSIEAFREDADFICHIKGYKLKVIYKYLESHPQLLDEYDYFFFPDDDIKMDAVIINALFDAMRQYKLKIAQPALSMSYSTWPHTLKNRYCKLRYTNFVEMMVPCFSKHALKKVLFTFNENETGWGTESHWPLLIQASTKDMAIIDDVIVVHTRPIQSGQEIHIRELTEYLQKYGISTIVEMYESISSHSESTFCCSEDTFYRLRNMLFLWIKSGTITTRFIGINGYFGYVYFLHLFAGITQSQENADLAFRILDKAQERMGYLMNDMSFEKGLTGCCWLIEYLINENFLQDDPSILFQSINRYFLQYYEEHKDNLSWCELIGFGMFYLQAGNFEMLNRIIPDLQTCYRAPRSFDEITMVFDTLDILNICGLAIAEYITELKQCANRIGLSQVEHAYFFFRIYRLTHDQNILFCVQKELKTLPPQLIDLSDAIKLAEMLYFNS